MTLRDRLCPFAALTRGIILLAGVFVLFGWLGAYIGELIGDLTK